VPAGANRLADKLEAYDTPKHRLWLNMAEIGAEIDLSVLARTCLAERIDNKANLQERGPPGNDSMTITASS
jgi:hypothetical protein